MLTAGLALLLLCGELTRLLYLSPLLAGMMVDFILINHAERDVRLFRIINSFEPSIYVLFFTLAGVHLNLSALKSAGCVGMIYFFTRILGKYFGTWLGAYLSGADRVVRNYLGLSLIHTKLVPWSSTVTPVVLAGVVFSELFDPLLVRITLEAVLKISASGQTPFSIG